MVEPGNLYQNCALGAAALAIGRNKYHHNTEGEKEVTEVVREIWPELNQPIQNPLSKMVLSYVLCYWTIKWFCRPQLATP
jgi:hypothetical protein